MLAQQEKLLAMVEQDIAQKESEIGASSEQRSHGTFADARPPSEPFVPGLSESNDNDPPMNRAASEAQGTMQPMPVQNVPPPYSSMKHIIENTSNQDQERSEFAASSKISDLISSQLAGVDSYLEAKKKQYGDPNINQNFAGFVPTEEASDQMESDMRAESAQI